MTRRLLAILVPLCATLALSSCATFDRNDVVARTNDAELTVGELDSWLSSSLYRAAGGESAASGETTRTIINLWLQRQVAVAAGIAVDPAADAGGATRYGDDWASAPTGFRDVLNMMATINGAQQSGTVDIEALRTRYSEMTVWVNPRYGVWQPGKGVLGYTGQSQ